MLSWLPSIWNKRLFFLILLAVTCGTGAGMLAYYQTQSLPDLSSNPYNYYDKTITARIGAYAPYAFLDKGGLLEGYVIDLTHAISRVMSARIVMLSRKLNDPQEYSTLHDADVVLCMVKTAATSKLYDFTPPYAIHSFTIFGRSGSAPLKNPARILEDPRLVINEDGVFYDLNREKLLQLNRARTTSAEEALRQVSRGEFDYVVLETYIGDQIIEKYGLENIVRIQETDEKVEYAFAARKGDAEVLKIFTEGMYYLQRTGQFEKIQSRWLEKRFLYTKSDRDAFILYFSIGLTVTLGIMLSFFLWSHTLAQQVKERTVDLEAEIAERNKTEQKLLRSQKQLIQADKLAAVGTLASGVAHEINNPNGLILLNISFMRQAFNDLSSLLQQCESYGKKTTVAGLNCNEFKKQMDLILNDTMQASLRIRDIVKDLKEFARPDSADWNELFNLNDAAKAALRLIGGMLKRSSDHIKTEYAENLPALCGSLQKIEQVILNLVINACQALPDKDRAIFIATFYDSKRNEVCLSVQDEGTGIRQEDMPHLFDPFFTTKREQGGTGLGLSICDTIAKAHCGTIEIRSSLNVGTMVILRIPAQSNSQGGVNP